MTDQASPLSNADESERVSNAISREKSPKKIVKIVIESKDGGDIGDFREENFFTFRITLHEDSIRYSYKVGINGVPGRWYYSSTSPIFKELFQKASKAVASLMRKDRHRALDATSYMYTVVYNDNTTEKKESWQYKDEEDALFHVVYQMAPHCECSPETPCGWFNCKEDDARWEEEYGESLTAQILAEAQRKGSSNDFPF